MTGALDNRQHPRSLTCGVSSAEAERSEELIRRFLPLARSVAHRFRHTGEPLDELIGAANLGLVQAARRYDPTRGVSFARFASVTIAGEVKHHLRLSRWSAHVPREVRDRAIQVHRALASAEATGQRLDREGLAQCCGLEEHDLTQALLARAAFSAVSLDEHLNGSAATLVDTLSTEEKGYQQVEDRLALRAALRRVRRPDVRVLELRYGGDLTQSEIASVTGVSQMQVSRVLRRAIGEARVAQTAGTP